MDNRTAFVTEVAKTIVENHEKHHDSFIFGISGKWGEGKTTFLDELENKLKSEDSSFKIFRINPWKFSLDRISFLRNFLRTLYVEGGIGNSADLKILDVDTSENAINWRNFALFTCWVLLICAIIAAYQPLFDFLKNLSAPWKFFFITVTIPVFLAMVQNVTTVQKTDHAITTLDQFDDFLTKILDRLSAEKKKIVIFVDDLDRVTPEMARDVLDNLRTFFDKPSISFVVTGDHTVLEGYLGRSLLPDETSAAQMEEGQRFLKKIFNVYWRLPLPIKKDLDLFIQGEFTKRATSLDSILTKPEDKAKFTSYLSKYFERNYRQIIRFLDTTLFTFQIIKQRIEDGSETATYFKEMLEKPLLVIRILMIQELCPPLFDRMVGDVQILFNLEYAVEKKQTQEVTKVIEENKSLLSRSQQRFIEQFIYEEPRFFETSSLQVSNLEPFLSLAADASFGDERGPSGADFMSDVAGGDPLKIRNALLSMGSIKAEAGAKALLTELPALLEPSRTNSMKAFLSAVADLSPENPNHKIFAEKLSGLDFSFINNAATDPKIPTINAFAHWLDLVGDDVILAKYKGKFVINDITQFNAIDKKNTGGFGSYLTASWLVVYYTQNGNDALNAMAAQFPTLKLDKVQKEIDGIKDTLINDLVRDPAAQPRDNRFVVIKNFVTDGKKILKTRILNEVSALNQDITGWSLSKVGEVDNPWTKNDVDDTILRKIESATDFAALNQALRFATVNKIGTPDVIWNKLLPSKKDLLIENVPSIISDASFEPIAPPEAYADQLMGAMVDKIKELEPAQQIQWLDYVSKGKWPWINLNGYPLRNKLDGFQTSENAQVEQALETAAASWGDTKKTEE